jgi:hypothetical protein
MESLLDFALMIKDPDASTPIYPLAVVQDDEEAKQKVALTSKIMEAAIMYAGATESKVQAVTRVDLNVSDGIARAAKELMITDVVLGWTDKTTTTERLFGSIFGTTLDNVLQSVWETIYVCDFHYPLNATRKLVVVMPKNAEYELGFLHYIQKIFLLSKQIGARLLLCCHTKTQAAIEAYLQQFKISVEITFKQFDNIEELLLLAKDITKNDLVMVVSARKGTLSYRPYLDGMPGRLSRHFPSNNIVLIYPEQTEMDYIEAGVQPEDLTLAPIQEQLANLNKLGKAVKRILKGKK